MRKIIYILMILFIAVLLWSCGDNGAGADPDPRQDFAGNYVTGEYQANVLSSSVDTTYIIPAGTNIELIRTEGGSNEMAITGLKELVTDLVDAGNEDGLDFSLDATERAVAVLNDNTLELQSTDFSLTAVVNQNNLTVQITLWGTIERQDGGLLFSYESIWVYPNITGKITGKLMFNPQPEPPANN